MAHFEPFFNEISLNNIIIYRKYFASIMKRYGKEVAGFCKLCDYTGNDTHIHHIVPRSRGGKDEESNLIEVCPECHSKLHDAELNTTSELTKLGINKVKENKKIIQSWLVEHEKQICEMLLAFFHKHGTPILTEMIVYDALHMSDIAYWLEHGFGRKHKPYGKLPSMLQTLWKEHPTNFGVKLPNFSVNNLNL